MPQLPDRHPAIGSGLIDVVPAGKGRFGVGRVERNVGGKGIEPAAPQMAQMIDWQFAHRAQFASIAGLTQHPRGGEPATVSKGREIDLDQLDPVQMRQQITRIIARLKPYGRRIGLRAEYVNRHAGIGNRFVIAKAELNVTNRLPP